MLIGYRWDMPRQGRRKILSPPPPPPIFSYFLFSKHGVLEFLPLRHEVVGLMIFHVYLLGGPTARSADL